MVEVHELVAFLVTPGPGGYLLVLAEGRHAVDEGLHRDFTIRVPARHGIRVPFEPEERPRAHAGGRDPAALDVVTRQWKE